MRKTIEQVTCDGCGELQSGMPSDMASIVLPNNESRDYCKTCVGAIRDQIEKAYRRLFHGEVPTRRGGYRKLGEYDG